MLALLAGLLQATPPIEVNATVDRDRVPVGDEIIYSLTAASAERGAFRVELPAIRGLEIVERVERLDEATAGSQRRIFRLDLTLRATEVGLWRLSPVVVAIGGEREVAPEIAVVVVGAAATDPNRNPRLMELIQRVPPPVPGRPAALTTVVSSPQVPQGGQLDVLTAAWFSRSLRGRLRRPPTLKPPVLPGVWSVPQPAVPGIIATRVSGDETFDLFVSHQVVFPLTPGVLTVPPARLEYAVPLSRRASGDERAEQAASESVRVEVTALPEAGRPDGFRGPTGHDLRLSYRIRALPGHAGEPLPVDLVLAGVGNLTFWAPPNVTWPPGTRAYLDRTEEAPRIVGGFLSGAKTFHFLLVPDSVGSIALPALGYPYFDAVTGTYRDATATGLVIPVLAGQNRLAARDAPPLVSAGPDRRWLEALEPRQPWWWIAVLAPMVVLVGVRLARVARRPVVPRAPRPDGVTALELLVSRVVPQANRGHAELLEQSLRRAGVTRDQAAETARLKIELDRLRFTPGDSTGISGLARRAGELIKALPTKVLRRGGVALVALVAIEASAQTESPETLYREGAFRPAASAFEERARRDPREWRHWYHAGAARYLAGEDAAAAARLFTALDLAPRAVAARSLWSTLERQYEPLHQARPWSGLSRAELGIASLGIVWVAATLALIGWRRTRLRWSVLAVSVGTVSATLVFPRPPPDLAFTTAAIRLHRAPHGLAAEEGGMPALTRVTVLQRRGGWSLVTDVAGNSGWLLATGLAPVHRVD